MQEAGVAGTLRGEPQMWGKAFPAQSRHRKEDCAGAEGGRGQVVRERWLTWVGHGKKEDVCDTLCLGNILLLTWSRLAKGVGEAGGAPEGSLQSTCQRVASSYNFGKVVILWVEPPGSVEIWCWKVGERSELTAALGLRNGTLGWELADTGQHRGTGFREKSRIHCWTWYVQDT